MDQIAHFQIKETLGFGALGTVYVAWDTKLNRVVALKVLSPGITSANLRERFHLEARTIAALKHPNIVSVLDFADAGAEVQYIALERLDGRSLQDFVHEFGPVPEQVALAVGTGVAAGLEYAHAQKVVHRDIKPDNVVLEGERVVIIDFGAMRLTDSHGLIPDSDVDKAPMAVGTPGFMAPEQLKGAAVDGRADVFALGATLYAATTGQLPYERVSSDPAELHKEARRGAYRDPRHFQPLLTPGFCDLLADLLAPTPGQRLANASEARQRIDALIAAHGIQDVPSVLKTYVREPTVDQELDLVTVDRLTRELKLALLRDFQRAVVSQDVTRIRDATNRLRYVHHLFGEAQKFFVLDQSERPPLLRGRRQRRRLWFLIGFLSAAFSALIAGAIRPQLFKPINQWVMHVLFKEPK